MKKSIFLLLIFFTLFSCSKDDDNIIKDDSVLVKRIETSDGSFYTTFTYEGNMLVKISSSNGYYQIYTYTGDLITHVDMYNSANMSRGSEDLEYFNNKLYTIKKYGPDGKITGKAEFTYNSDESIITCGATKYYLLNGNIVKIEESLTNYCSYTYDNKNNPFKNIMGIKSMNSFYDSEFIGNANNVLTITNPYFINHDETTQIQYTYEYNSQDYPISQTIVGSTIKLQYFY